MGTISIEEIKLRITFLLNETGRNDLLSTKVVGDLYLCASFNTNSAVEILFKNLIVFV